MILITCSGHYHCTVKKYFFFLFILTIVAGNAHGQGDGLHIKKAKGKIIVDAQMDEADWLEAEPSGKFMQFFPADTSFANAQTEIRMTYDDRFIYVFAKMDRIQSNKYVTPSLRRDFRGEANDGVTVVFDTFKDKTNGFMFGVNPYGVQREGLISNGGSESQNLSLDWDNKWYAEAKIHDGYWVAEMAIPWKTIRFKEGLGSWLVNFYRIDSEFAERSMWSPVPRVFSMQSLAYNRELIWDEPLKSPGPNISLIPYAAGQYNRNFTEGTPSEKKVSLGGDAKIAISSALNLDLTINPDFSQVEVDEQVTNLDRFEIFFPEKRQFFLENADLFADFGLEGMRPFFSRRIGVARDTATGQNIQNPIYFGGRLSGKVNNNLRVGFLTMQTGEVESIEIPSTNFTVATFQQKILARSNIGMIFINKQAFQDSIKGEFTTSPEAYNRVIGLDFNLASADNKWGGKFFYHHSFDEEKLDSTFAMGARLTFNTVEWDFSATAQNIGANYNPEVGFARRTDYLRLAPTVYYNFYPASATVRSHGPGFDFDLIGNKKYGLLDYDVNLLYRIKFLNTAEISIRLRRQYTYLFDDFDPTNTDGVELPANTDYTNHLFIARFESNKRNLFTYSLSTRSGGYFNGNRLNLDAQAGYRFQPFGSIGLTVSYNRLQMPKPYTSTDLIVLGNRIDITFTRNLFWTTFIQYNNQINNLNINSRIQWRFRPVSDLFFVYTDNYATDTFTNDEFGITIPRGGPKLRSFVVKFTYWLNL